MAEEKPPPVNAVDVALEQIRGFRGLVPGSIVSTPKGQVLYAAGAWILISLESDPTKQELLKGHKEPISCMALSNSAGLAASGDAGPESDVVVWDLPAREPIYRFSEHDHGISCIAFSPDDKLLVSVGSQKDKKLIVWDMTSGGLVTRTKLDADVRAVTFLPSLGGQYRFATASSTGVTFWDVDPYAGVLSSEPAQVGMLKRSYSCLLLAPDGTLLLAGTESGDVATFTTNGKALQHVVPCCSKGVTVIAGPVQDGTYLAGGGDGTVNAFLADPGLPYKWGDLKTPTMPLHAGSTRNTVASFSGAVTSLSCPPGGEEAIVGTSQSAIYRMSTFDYGVGVIHENHYGAITEVAFGDSHSDILATSSEDKSVIIWSVDDYGVLSKATCPMAGKAECVVLDGDTVISGWEDGEIRAHSIAGGNLVWSISNAHKGGVSKIAVAHDGSYIVSGGAKGELRVWDRENKGLIAELKEHNQRVTGLQVFKGYHAVVSCSRDKTMTTWDVSKGTQLSTHTQRAGGINSIALSDDQIQVVSVGQEKKITFWDLREDLPLQVVTDAHGGEGNCVAISPDNLIFATGGTDRTLRIWEFATGRLVAEVDGHSSSITDLKFSPNGKRLVTAGSDGLTAIWSIRIS